MQKQITVLEEKMNAKNTLEEESIKNMGNITKILTGIVEQASRKTAERAINAEQQLNHNTAKNTPAERITYPVPQVEPQPNPNIQPIAPPQAIINSPQGPPKHNPTWAEIEAQNTNRAKPTFGANAGLWARNTPPKPQTKNDINKPRNDGVNEQAAQATLEQTLAEQKQIEANLPEDDKIALEQDRQKEANFFAEKRRLGDIDYASWLKEEASLMDVNYIKQSVMERDEFPDSFDKREENDRDILTLKHVFRYPEEPYTGELGGKAARALAQVNFRNANRKDPLRLTYTAEDIPEMFPWLDNKTYEVITPQLVNKPIHGLINNNYKLMNRIIVNAMANVEKRHRHEIEPYLNYIIGDEWDNLFSE